ncbi:MAG: hypothetical protein D3916_07445 [Candidatus Electrothrix sp. MAN1_4]|nr:hypothetical protein [Candidatus Electrothrix sp. MAN1_4]
MRAANPIYEMDLEDDILDELESLERTVLQREKALEENAKALAESAKALTEKDVGSGRLLRMIRDSAEMSCPLLLSVVGANLCVRPVMLQS